MVQTVLELRRGLIEMRDFIINYVQSEFWNANIIVSLVMIVLVHQSTKAYYRLNVI